MKNVCTGIIILSAAALFSCNADESKSTETTSSDSAVTSSGGDTISTFDSSNTLAADINNSANTAAGFLVKAAGSGMMEVELGKIARLNGYSQAVKDFAKMMETDHSKANNELKSLASSKNINLPAAMPAEHQLHIDHFKGLKGADFDKAYITMMVEDHNKDIAEFERAASNNADAEVKSFASRTLPVLKKHLEEAKRIQGRM